MNLILNWNLSQDRLCPLSAFEKSLVDPVSSLQGLAVIRTGRMKKADFGLAEGCRGLQQLQHCAALAFRRPRPPPDMAAPFAKTRSEYKDETSLRSKA